LRLIGGFWRFDRIEFRNSSLGPGKLEVQRDAALAAVEL